MLRGIKTVMIQHYFNHNRIYTSENLLGRKMSTSLINLPRYYQLARKGRLFRHNISIKCTWTILNAYKKEHLSLTLSKSFYFWLPWILLLTVSSLENNRLNQALIPLKLGTAKIQIYLHLLIHYYNLNKIILEITKLKL